MNYSISRYLVDEEFQISCAQESDSAMVQRARTEMFLEFCAVLENNFIRYVMLSGYEDYPTHIYSDVDFLVGEQDFTRLPSLLVKPGLLNNASLIQVIEHEVSGRYFVFSKLIGDRVAYLQPDATCNYRRRGRLWLTSEALLAGRRKAESGFWIPAPAIEFEYYLIKRLDKGIINEQHVERLASLQAQDWETCQQVIFRLLGKNEVKAMETAIRLKNAKGIQEDIPRLQRLLRRSSYAEPFFGRVLSSVQEWKRRLTRIQHPTGFILSVLGPDGSGKTTILEHLERELLGAFRATKRFHLRPRFNTRVALGPPVTEPHAKKARLNFVSALKVIWFTCDYCLSWLGVILPAKIRSTLVLFDRYYDDMIVDPKRYRISKSFSLPALFSKIIPSPDIFLFLHVDSAVAYARKSELPIEVLNDLIHSYEKLVLSKPNSVRINTSGTLQESLGEALRVVLNKMEVRTKKRIEKEKTEMATN